MNFTVVLLHPLTNLEIKRYWSVYSWNNLLNAIKDGAYEVNFDEYTSIGTHLISVLNTFHEK